MSDRINEKSLKLIAKKLEELNLEGIELNMPVLEEVTEGVINEYDHESEEQYGDWDAAYEFGHEDES